MSPLDRLHALRLPQPLEQQIGSAFGEASFDVRHERAIFAWKTTCRVMGSALWAACRAVGASSTGLQNHARAMERPSFGDWAALVRESAGALARNDHALAQPLRPLLEGLSRKLAGAPELEALAERMRGFPKLRPQLRGCTLGHLLQVMATYRGIVKADYEDPQPHLRERNAEIVLAALLEFLEIAPPLGRYRAMTPLHLEKDEPASVLFFHGAHAWSERCALAPEPWSRLSRGAAFLLADADTLVALDPFAICDLGEGRRELRWMVGGAGSQRVLYQGTQLALHAGDLDLEAYEQVFGGPKLLPVDPQALVLDPWRGLESYGEEHAAIFFGRDHEIGEALERWENEGFLILCGASGSGKSSLVQAGLLPALRRRIEDEGGRVLVLRCTPGPEPMTALRAAYIAASEEFELGPAERAAWSAEVTRALPHELQGFDSQALVHLLRGLSRPDYAVVLAVDQLEEALIQTTDVEQGARFLDLLIELSLAEPKTGWRVIATLRADALSICLEHPGFARIAKQRLVPLGPLADQRVVDVLRGPLRGRGVEFEPALEAEILRDLGARPGSIPLLSLVLTRLWQQRQEYGNRLTLASYEALGRIGGVLENLADEAHAEAFRATDSGGILDHALLLLSALDPERGASRRRRNLREMRDALGLDERQIRALLAPFVARRLLVLNATAATTSDDDTVEVSHEALFRDWPHFAKLLRESSEAIEIGSAVEAAANSWDAAQRRTELWSDATSRLRHAEELLATGRLKLPTREREFLAASRAGVERQRRRKRFAVSLLAVLFIAAALGFLWARYERSLAQERERSLLALATRAELDELLRRAEGELWPLSAKQLPALQQWLTAAEALMKRRDEIERARVSEPAEKRSAFDRVLRALDEFGASDGEPSLELSSALAPTLPGVRRRIELTALWHARSLADTATAELWREIATAPREHLVPLGKNARGLWECWHVPSGAKPEPSSTPPASDALDRWTITGDTGIVFVRVPGGRSALGAQSTEHAKPNFETGAQVDEGRVYEVDFRPYWISKYEMTEGQWLRLTGRRGDAERQLDHPVTRISWEDARILEKIGLHLPTEAQWEHACRGGQATPWWTGDATPALRDAENLSGRLSPVGRKHCNPFGLHDVAGNVSEWCFEAYVSDYAVSRRAGDGLREEPESSSDARSTRDYVHRGASAIEPPENARSARRFWKDGRTRSPWIGLRLVLLEEP